MFQGIPIFMNSGGKGYLLDGLADEAAVAFSLRKVRRETGNRCIRVRRSSDNTEQDIGFDVNNNIDQSALTTFCGAGDGFVATWYDQSINQLNADQHGTPGFQPKIVSSGVVNTLNGKPCVHFDTAFFNFMDVPNSTIYTAVGGEWSAFGVGNFDDTTHDYSWWDADWQASMRLGQFLRSVSGPSAAVAFNTITGAFGDSGPIISTSQILLHSKRTATTVESYANNVTNGSTATTGTPKTGMTVRVEIGASNGGGVQRLLGSLQEIIHFGSATDYRTTLTDRINSYYGVY